jgi:GNAT superfamily N-acetyltransferase
MSIDGIAIRPIDRPEDPDLKRVYDCFHDEVFDPDEVDPLERMSWELAQTLEGRHPYPMVYLGLFDAGGEAIGGCYGNVFRGAGGPEFAFAAVGLNGVVPRKRGLGLGARLYREFEARASKAATALGLAMKYSVLESNVEQPGDQGGRYMDARPFWSRMGFMVAPGLEYSQPSMDFAEDGSPVNPAIPIELMIKPESAATRMEADDLRSILETLVREWYYPDPELFSPLALAKARSHVDGILLRAFDSLGARDELSLEPY